MTLLLALIVSVWLAMKQYDRQWDELKSIRQQVEGQARDLRGIQDMLKQGVAVTTPRTSTTTQQIETADNNSSNDDPFSRIRAAQAMPNYAKGGSLLDSFGNHVGKLTPMLSSDAYAAEVQNYVLESLAVRDPDTLEYKPMLSRSWIIRDNSKAHDDAVAKLKAAGKKDEEIAKDTSVPPAIQIVFKMRPGVRFSDGEPLTADDVVFTYKFTMDPAINSPRDKAYFIRITSVEKTAPDEVTFTFNEPYFEAFNLAAGMAIYPKHFFGKFKPEDFNQSVGLLLGSGPYRMEDPTTWKPGTLIQLLRNERYWGVQPAFDRLVWNEITNDVAHTQAFRNGDIQILPCQPEQYRSMIADQGLVARTQHFEYQSPVGGYRFVAWNQKKDGKPSRFADKRVRQAMTMLLDRQRMIQEVMLGYAVQATGPFNPLSKQYNPEIKPWPFDVTRAKALLKEAGFEDRNNDGVIEGPDGAPFQFKLTYPSGSANYEKMVLFMKDAYARAGVVLKPDPLDWAVMVERLNNKNFEAISLGWTAGIETDIFQMFHSSQMVAEGDDFMSYKNEELDQLINQARRAINEDERMPLWRKCHAILHEDQPYTFLSFGKSLVFLDNTIQDVKLTKRMGLNDRTEWFEPVGQQRQPK